MKRVTFEDRNGNGEGPWIVTVDARVVIDNLRSSDMDVSANALAPLWEAVGIEMEFKWASSPMANEVKETNMPLHEYSNAELEAELQKRTARTPRWGLFIPEQWVEGVMGSSKAVVEEVAARTVRGVKWEARFVESITRPGQIGDEDG